LDIRVRVRVGGALRAPRRQSLLRSQARSALLPAATPRMMGLRRPIPPTKSMSVRASHVGAKRVGPIHDPSEPCLGADSTYAGGRRGKERAASLRAEQRLAAGGRSLPRPVRAVLHGY